MGAQIDRNIGKGRGNRTQLISLGVTRDSSPQEVSAR